MAKASNHSHNEVNIDDDNITIESVNSQTVASDDVTDDKAGEYLADLQRLQAEFTNFKRRVDTERTELLNFAKSQVVKDFLAVRDNFDRELTHRPTSIDANWAASIDAIRNQFDQVMKNLGVERFESVGQIFDPHLHEAIAHEGDGETVTEELQAGYKLGEQVLRHAMGKVGNK